jgi:hypothetical protein
MLGVFVQSSRFIPQYAHIVRPLTELTRCEKGQPVPYIWTPERQTSYDHVRNLLLDGIHLAPPDYRLPFHSGGDASNDGKAYGIHQFCDSTYRVAQTLLSLPTRPPKPPSVLLTQTLSIPFPTTPTRASTWPCFPRLGLTPIGKGPHFTSRPIPSCGVLRNAVSGLYPPHSPCTPRATTCP